MTGVAYVIVVKRAAMRQANLAAVTVAARVAAVVTNVSSGSRAVANRSSIVHNGRRVVAVNGIRTVEARTTPGMFILPIEFVRTFIIAI